MSGSQGEKMKRQVSWREKERSEKGCQKEGTPKMVAETVKVDGWRRETPDGGRGVKKESKIEKGNVELRFPPP